MDGMLLGGYVSLALSLAFSSPLLIKKRAERSTLGSKDYYTPNYADVFALLIFFRYILALVYLT